MKIKTLTSSILAGIVAIAFTAGVSADHNSPFGEGWAGMPNDIHNTVVEDDLSGQDFMDFVSQGSGADSVNRYTDDDTNGGRPSVTGGGNGGGNSRGGRS
jgi:hypothetical protein